MDSTTGKEPRWCFVELHTHFLSVLSLKMWIQYLPMQIILLVGDHVDLEGHLRLFIPLHLNV